MSSARERGLRRSPKLVRRLVKRMVPVRYHLWKRHSVEPIGLLLSHRQWRPRSGVVHIGAHYCEEQPLYRSLGIPDARVLWIEAQPQLAAKTRAVQAVISDVDGEEVDFTITSNSQSSSMFRLKEHAEIYPDIVATSTIRLRTTTLDSLYGQLGLPFDFADLVVLDIQGAELRALRGATRVLTNARAVITEVSRRELYEGCALYPEVRGFLESAGLHEVEVRWTPAGWGGALFGRLPSSPGSD